MVLEMETNPRKFVHRRVARYFSQPSSCHREREARALYYGTVTYCVPPTVCGLHTWDLDGGEIIWHVEYDMDKESMRAEELREALDLYNKVQQGDQNPDVLLERVGFSRNDNVAGGGGDTCSAARCVRFFRID